MSEDINDCLWSYFRKLEKTLDWQAYVQMKENIYFKLRKQVVNTIKIQTNMFDYALYEQLEIDKKCKIE